MHTLRNVHVVNVSLNGIYPPKRASINPEGKNTDGDEDQCVSVAVQLISEIRWRPYREMRIENERWNEKEGEKRVMGQPWKRDIQRCKDRTKIEKQIFRTLDLICLGSASLLLLCSSNVNQLVGISIALS